MAGGDKYPRKGGLGITSCDLLVINKTDLAPMVGADLEVMRADALRIRGTEKPSVFVNCMADQGIPEVADLIVRNLLFGAPPKGRAKKVGEVPR